MPPTDSADDESSGSEATSAPDNNPTKQRRLSWDTKMSLLVFLGQFAFACISTPTLIGLAHFACDPSFRGQPYQGREIDLERCQSLAAASVSLMTATGNVASLFSFAIAEPVLRRVGLKAAFVFTAAWPIARNLVQLAGVLLGGRAAIALIVLSGLLGLVAGRPNFAVTAQQYLTQALSSDGEDAGSDSLANLRSASLFGEGAGLLLGGIAADVYGLRWLFVWSSVIFALIAIAARFCLTTLPDVVDEARQSERSRLANMVGALHAFKPLSLATLRKRKIGKKWTHKKYWGFTFLGLADFWSVLAMGFVSPELQLMASQSFGFSASETGFLAVILCFAQAFFLRTLFKWILARGQRAMGDIPRPAKVEPRRRRVRARLARRKAEEEASSIPGAADESAESSSSTPAPTADAKNKKPKGGRFDFVFLKSSVVGEVLLLGLITQVRKGKDWQLYLAIAVLPVVSATSPLYQGVLLSLVPPDAAAMRAEAFAGLGFIERLASIGANILMPFVLGHFASRKGGANPAYAFGVNALLAAFAAPFLAMVRTKQSPGHRARQRVDQPGGSAA